MPFFKPYRFIVISVTIIVCYYGYYLSTGFPSDDELIRVRGNIIGSWEIKNDVKLRLKNERFGAFYARISTDNFNAEEKPFNFDEQELIWIDVLVDDFYVASWYDNYTFNPVYGWGTSTREISNLESYSKRKLYRLIAESLILLTIAIGLDLFIRKRIYKNIGNRINQLFPQEGLELAYRTFDSIRGELLNLLIGVGFLAWALYVHFDNLRVFDYSDLRSLELVLKERPEYDTFKIKRTTYRNINLRAYGYTKDFKINNFTFKSTDHDRLKAELNRNDTVSVWITKSDTKNLKSNEIVNNYNEIFGLVNNSYNYIDFDDRNEYQKNQNKWGKYLLGFFGIISIAHSIRKIKKRLTDDKLNEQTEL